MDLTRSVVFRGLDINSVSRGGPTLLTYSSDSVTYGGDLVTYGAGMALGLPASGCMTETADISDIPTVEFAERVRVHDGYNVLEGYRGNWVVHLSGSLFGATRGDLFDRLQNLRRVMSPDTALRDSPSTKGFLPLTYREPHDLTALTVTTLQCRPMGLQWKADEGTAAKVPGREDYTALALRWTVDLLVYQGPILQIGSPPGTPPGPDSPIDWPPGGGGGSGPPPRVPPTCVGNGNTDGGNGVTYNFGDAQVGAPLGAPTLTTSYPWEWMYPPSTDFLQYWSTFHNNSRDYPTAGLIFNGGNGGVNCCVYSTGGVDYMPGGIAGYVRLTTIGPGTLTIRTAPTLGGSCGGGITGCGTITAPGTAYAVVPGTGVVVGSDSQDVGVNMVVHIADTWEDAYHNIHPVCAVYTDVHFATGPWGFVSASWAPGW